MQDISKIKKEIRLSVLNRRKNLDKNVKKQHDTFIFNNLINTNEYKNAKIILTYISTDIEIDTINLINKALADGKKVAVPLSNTENLAMEFYLIESFCDVELGSYNILEPKKYCKIVNLKNEEEALIIVPALTFDKFGYRVGFGKGYYDRFLKNFSGIKIGICYKEELVLKLPKYPTDIKVDILVSQCEIVKSENEN